MRERRPHLKGRACQRVALSEWHIALSARTEMRRYKYLCVLEREAQLW